MKEKIRTQVYIFCKNSDTIMFNGTDKKYKIFFNITITESHFMINLTLTYFNILPASSPSKVKISSKKH